MSITDRMAYKLPAHTDGPDTSHEAAETNARTRRAESRAWVEYALTVQYPAGATADEIKAWSITQGCKYGLTNRLASQISEMLTAGELERTHERRQTRAGGWAYVVRYPAGRAPTHVTKPHTGGGAR